MGKQLADQAVVITGASSGLGRASALAFANAGANVALIARSEQDLRAVAESVDEQGSHALVLPTNLADAVVIQQAVNRVVESVGRVDVLVNNAGTDVPGPINDLTVDGWDHVLNVNLHAPFLLTKAVFPHMQQVGRGTILNISSVAGKLGWANASAYCASKFGLTGFTQALHAEGKEFGIRAMIIYPGAMATHWGDWTPEERHQHNQETSSAREALPPEDAASLLVWLAESPHNMVLNEVVLTPLEEQGWP